MRLSFYEVAGVAKLGVPQGDSLVGLWAVHQLLTARGDASAKHDASLLMPNSVVSFLAGGAHARILADQCLAGLSGIDADALRRSGAVDRIADVKWLPTMLGAEKLICVGRNYLEHVRETQSEVPDYPVLFSRYWPSVVGHKQPLVKPRLSDKFDFEGELVAVIGSPCRYVPRDRALDVVAGYTILQEGSIRDWQHRAPTQMAGKNFYRTGAMGPWLVTADEIPDPSTLRITTTLNGELMQDAQTSQMIINVQSLIEYITQFMPLQPGDLIATGTPSGVGAERRPPVFLKPGDLLAVEISRIGRLENSVIDEADLAEAVRS